MSKILIVDSLADSRARYTNTLSQAGYVVFEATSGETALETAAAVAPDLVIVSIVLPGLTGLETAAKLRTLLKSNSPRILVLGHVPPIGIEDEPLISLVDGYLSRDISDGDLLARVRNELQPKRR